MDVVRVYRREVRRKPDTTAAGGRFERPIELAREAGDVLLTPLLPGLELRLADVLRD